MLIEIPIQKVPNNINRTDTKLIRLPCVNNDKDDLVFEIISSNIYLQSVITSLYNIDIEGFPYYITIPKTLLSDLTSLPLIQSLNQIFKFQRAMVDSNSIVSKLMVKDLTPRAIEIIKQLYSANKIDTIYEFLFKNIRTPSENLNTVKAYTVSNKFTSNQNCKISNLHKYILWESISNNSNIYGSPIGSLSLQDIESNLFKEFCGFFEEVYIIGCGNPWYATHLIIKMGREMMANPRNEISPF